ncbi:hypothetical protein J1605_013466 [Eschrichtius robustus]|uniref:Uncharacterized protein n=1 Tax=Eschrichtius robustus TaxID=9764 RepID=A0AB34GK77_ESCRO|nr:hypothetical protein J1605_013466 [Eschrichtius robustus]
MLGPPGGGDSRVAELGSSSSVQIERTGGLWPSSPEVGPALGGSPPMVNCRATPSEIQGPASAERWPPQELKQRNLEITSKALTCMLLGSGSL